LPVIRNYIQSAVRIIVQVTRLKGGARKMTRISEIVGLKRRKQYVVKDIFGFRQTAVKNGVAVGEFYATGYVPDFLPKLHAHGIDLSPEMFRERVVEVGNK